MGNLKLRRILFVLFFLSGLAALVYEVTWARKLSLIFGTTTYAVSSILAVFFAGLALGSWLFGRWVDEGKNPLRTYAFLELGIGLYAALTPWIFKLIESLQVSFWQRFSASGGPTYSGFSVFTFGLSFLGLIIPTTLMGGTLPVISKAFSVQRLAFRIGRDVGFLYFVNTAGAVLGAVLAGFWLIMALGVNQAIWVAAGINLLIGIVVLAGGRNQELGIRKQEAGIRNYESGSRNKERLAASVKRQGKRKEHSAPSVQRLVLIAFGLAGFAALALEVLWTRVLVMVFGGSVYAFTIVLVAFLVGIALGSAIMARFADRLRNILIWFAGIKILLGASVIFLTPLLGDLPFWFLRIFESFGESFVSLQFGLFLLAFGVMILPTFLMGMAFPVVVKAFRGIGNHESGIRNKEHLGSSVGAVYAANTVGGIFGSLAAGFVFIPLIGTQKGIWVAAVIYLLVGAGIILIAKAQKWLKILMVTFAILPFLIGFSLPSWNKPVLTYGFYDNPYDFVGKTKEEVKKLITPSKIIFYKEGPTATVAVHQDLYEGVLSLRINGKRDASTGADMENQLLLGYLPMFFHEEPENVLVVGMGSGITLGSVEQYPVKRIEAIEIEPAVVEAAQYFADDSHNALADPRLNLIVADGRNYLLALRQAQGKPAKKYDVITSEPSNPWLTGSSKLFTKEYFELMRDHLTDKGVVMQWVNLYSLDEEDLRTLVRTFKSVFPNALAFNVFTSDDFLLIGGRRQLVLDLEQIRSKMKQEKVKADLARVGIEDPLEILVYLTMDEKTMEEFAQDAPLNTDDHPILEFSAPKSLYVPTQAENLRAIMEVWIDPSVLIRGPFDKAKLKELIGFREYFAQMMIAFTEYNFGEGITAGEKARAIKDNHPGVNEYLAWLYFEKAHYLLGKQKGQEAKQNLLRALEIKPVTQTRLILGSIYIDEGRTVEAQEQFEAAVEASPEVAVVHFNLGLVLEQVGDLNRAIEEFERTLELDSEFLKAHEELAKLYELRGDYGKAEEHRRMVTE